MCLHHTMCQQIHSQKHGSLCVCLITHCANKFTVRSMVDFVCDCITHCANKFTVRSMVAFVWVCITHCASICNSQSEARYALCAFCLYSHSSHYQMTFTLFTKLDEARPMPKLLVSDVSGRFPNISLTWRHIINWQAPGGIYYCSSIPKIINSMCL